MIDEEIWYEQCPDCDGCGFVEALDKTALVTICPTCDAFGLVPHGCGIADNGIIENCVVSLEEEC